MLNTGRDKEASAWLKDVAFPTDDQDARSGMNEVQLVLSVWGLWIGSCWRIQLDRHRTMLKSRSESFAQRPLVGNLTWNTQQKFRCSGFQFVA